MTIKAIIVDFGGVLLRTADFTPREKLAARLGMSRSDLEEFIFGGESGDKAQRGEITVQQHLETLRLQLKVSPQEMEGLLNEFFAHDELDETLIDYLRKLHQTYKTALLSNAWNDLRQVIAEKWQFEDAFDFMIISAEEGLTKPDPRIFQLALDRLGVEASQAIFVDDMHRNVGAAKEMGIHTIQFKTSTQARFDVEAFLNGH